MTEKPPRGPLPGEPILLKENPARYLLEDAERAVVGSRGARDRGDAETEASFARSAVFLYFAALEGFINFVYAWSEVEDPAYERVEPWLLAGRLPAQQTSQPGAPTTPMTLSVWGGKMVVEGVPVEAEGGYAPTEGSTYVLFLRPARRSTLPNNYELHGEGIFEIDGDRVMPLFRDAISVFGGTIDRDVNAFTARIRNVADVWRYPC